MADKHDKKYIGAHVSTAGGVENAPLNAVAIGANAFAMFVKSQRQWKSPPLIKPSIDAFVANMAKSGISPDHVIPHAGYLINLATPIESSRVQSIDSLIGEMERCRQLSLKMINVHPGSFVKIGTPEDACKRVSDSINRVLDSVEGVDVVLENTAGQGCYLGARFEELAAIIDGVADSSRVGVCFDTAHAYGAGFDITTGDGFKRTFAQFDRIIGFDRLRAMHLNDTAVERGSHADRHAQIGEGALGWPTFKRIMDDVRFDGIPLVLETPDEEKWAEEIRRLGNL